MAQNYEKISWEAIHPQVLDAWLFVARYSLLKIR
jgi:hypothetical protein